MSEDIYEQLQREYEIRGKDNRIGEILEYIDSLKSEVESLGSLREKYRHYFTPQENNSRFCAECGLYFLDDIHIGMEKPTKEREQ